MPLSFTKLHGLGNDYIYVSTFDQTVAYPERLARVISDRHRGVGSDGLILVGPPSDPAAHVRMIVYNADGSRARMCGNGSRCVAKLAYERGWAHVNPLRIESDAGVRSAELTLDAHDRVTAARVDMGPPILDPRAMPATLVGDRIVAYPLDVCGEQLAVTCVSTGSPHAIFFVRDVGVVPLATWGPAVEHHLVFPDRINAHFVHVVRRDLLRMITWERGSGATLACGTGASAVCVAGVLNGVSARNVTIELPGGRLMLEWCEQTNHVYMTGPATEVFTGLWPT
jgi:diaminopimelate epimerase